MKMKYMMILAAALFAVGLPQADAAPKKSKKAKAAKKAAAGEFNFDIVSDAEVQADREEKKAKKQAEEAEQARLDRLANPTTEDLLKQILEAVKNK